MEALYEKVVLSQDGDKEAMLSIIDKFMPLIKNLSYKLRYEDAKSELIYALIDVIKNIPVRENDYLKDEKCIVGYINKSLRNRYIHLSQKNYITGVMETCLEMEIKIEESYDNIEDLIMIEQLLKKLPHKHREVMKGIYIENKKQTEIASELKLSRQAINKMKRQAIEHLRNTLNSNS